MGSPPKVIPFDYAQYAQVMELRDDLRELPPGSIADLKWCGEPIARVRVLDPAADIPYDPYRRGPFLFGMDHLADEPEKWWHWWLDAQGDRGAPLVSLLAVLGVAFIALLFAWFSR